MEGGAEVREFYNLILESTLNHMEIFTCQETTHWTGIFDSNAVITFTHIINTKQLESMNCNSNPAKLGKQH